MIAYLDMAARVLIAVAGLAGLGVLAHSGCTLARRWGEVAAEYDRTWKEW